MTIVSLKQWMLMFVYTDKLNITLCFFGFFLPAIFIANWCLCLVHACFMSFTKLTWPDIIVRHILCSLCFIFRQFLCKIDFSKSKEYVLTQARYVVNEGFCQEYSGNLVYNSCNNPWMKVLHKIF